MNTRLISAALLADEKNNVIELNDPLGSKVDVISFNEYYGWYVGGLPGEIGKYVLKLIMISRS
jgi:beta-glucuronidase